LAQPPFVETYGKAADLEREVCEEWHDGELDNFLLNAREGRQQNVRMLGKMVGPMILPETIHLVHIAMVHVEEKIQDDRVQGELGKDPWAECDRRRWSIRQAYCQGRARDDDTWEAGKYLVYEGIGYSLPGISIAVMESGPVQVDERLEVSQPWRTVRCSVTHLDATSFKQ
jgi:hypothetical protein